MESAAGKNKDIVHLLNNLIELDFDAIEAYAAAIARLTDGHDKESLRAFMLDHTRHTKELSAQVRELGGQPKSHADIKQVLTKGKVVLAGLIGDAAILWAMRSNEDDTNKAYEQAVEHQGLPSQHRNLLEQNLNDERRHRAWIEHRLQAKEASHAA